MKIGEGNHGKRAGLGADGPELSVIGLGCNNFGMKVDFEASSAVINAAIDTGSRTWIRPKATAKANRRSSSGPPSGLAGTKR